MTDEKAILVNGHGEIEATPDVAVISLGVGTRESEARAAMQAASDRMRAVIAAVKGQGVPDHDIQTTSFNLQLERPASVYQASHQLTIRTGDVANAGAILDAAVEAGANASSGVGFALADPAGAEDRALELAVADARRKAETAARALGVVIEQVDRLSVSGGDVIHHGASFGRLGFSAPPAAPVEVGRLHVAVDIEVAYRFH